MSLKTASTILVLAPGIVKNEAAFNVLMIQRSNKARFMPGRHVFPGGIIEDTDFNEEWKHILHYEKMEENIGLKIAGIREVFEETNVLLSKNKPAISNKEIAVWRADIQKDSTKFIKFFNTFNCSPDVESIIPWSRWVTPLQERYRYDTYFYIAPLAHLPEAIHDGSETTRFDWFSPVEALHKFANKQIILPPPTYLVLLELARYKTIEQVVAASKFRDLSPIQPHLEIGDNNSMICILPGDYQYPNSTGSKAKNRLYVHTDNTIVAEYTLSGDSAAPIKAAL